MNKETQTSTRKLATQFYRDGLPRGQKDSDVTWRVEFVTLRRRAASSSPGAEEWQWGRIGL
jgi:hypothetical protein